MSIITFVATKKSDKIQVFKIPCNYDGIIGPCNPTRRDNPHKIVAMIFLLTVMIDMKKRIVSFYKLPGAKANFNS